MKTKIYYITYKNKEGLIATKPIFATSEKNALKAFNKTGYAINEFIKISTDII